jgi:hypothetical protein
MKDSLMIQGVHYKLLAEKKLGIHDIPFYYFVFSSTDANNVKIIRQEVDESKMQSHIVAINNIMGKIKMDLNNGFNALPSMQRCGKCPLYDNCPSKVDYPLINEVFY